MNIVATIQAVQNGDRDAFAELVAAYQDMLLAYAAFRVPDSDLVEEIVQQAFIRAFEQIADYDSSRDFGIWLRTICKYVMLAELKRITQTQRNIKNYQSEIRHRLVRASIERCEAEITERPSKLEQCMQRLQEKARSLIEFRYALRLPVEEVAKRLGISVSHAAVSLFRVRGALRKCMERSPESTEGVSS
jgi:RNA polymerase sigma-70 factor (ECF subfamily)